MSRTYIPRETNLQVWGIPENLKTEFKAACAKRNVTIKSVIKDAMRQFIRETQIQDLH